MKKAMLKLSQLKQRFLGERADDLERGRSFSFVVAVV